METASFLRIAAIAFATLAGFSLVRGYCLQVVLSLQAALPDQGEGFHGFMQSWLQHGVPALFGAADAFLHCKPVHDQLQIAVEYVSEQGISATARSLMSLLMVALAALVLLFALVLQSLASGAAVVCGMVALCLAFLHSWKDKRRESIAQSVPDCIQSMEACFQAGYSLEQTFDQLSKKSESALSTAFGHCSQALSFGMGADQALKSLRQEIDIPELEFLSVALDVQHQTGGSMREILDSAEQSIREQLDLRRSLRVQTAQARLSARVVSAMPFVLAAVFSLLTEGFLDPFFESFAGMFLLCLALSMQVLGIVLVRRTLNVKGVMR